MRRGFCLSAYVTWMCLVTLAGSPLPVQAAGVPTTRPQPQRGILHRTDYHRAAPTPPVSRIGQDLAHNGVFIVDPILSSRSWGGAEPSIAINPANPAHIAITRFGNQWPSYADLLYSIDGGTTWAEEATIPPPPNLAGTDGCPCDQTIDYGQDGRLYGAFALAAKGEPVGIVTGSTMDPTDSSAWKWNGTLGLRQGPISPGC